MLDESVLLIALCFTGYHKEGAALPPSVLADLGPLPLRLMYIKWDVSAPPTTYAIGEQNGSKSAAAPMFHLPHKQKWVDWTYTLYSNSLFKLRGEKTLTGSIQDHGKFIENTQYSPSEEVAVPPST
ncbi:hypothetical protein B0H10DRAFT_1948539 [Mycena sp. CBHHK59/15]|nr:hypothetical protein B0H10DRAFT_1948539 [Mycena sp. CBHHK59/15]